VSVLVVAFRAIDRNEQLSRQVPPSDAADEPIEHFERVTAVNQRGVWACMKHELRVMRDQGSGAIVNCSSLGTLASSAVLFVVDVLHPVDDLTV
jgi:NAD(P)-dependent dehydrogenase (short-subunit alcohol dehydrogenase family)